MAGGNGNKMCTTAVLITSLAYIFNLSTVVLRYPSELFSVSCATSTQMACVVCNFVRPFPLELSARELCKEPCSIEPLGPPLKEYTSD